MPSGAVNNVNMQPDGSTTFAEIDLPAGDSTTPPNTSRIRWVKLASGAVVAEAYAYDSSGLGQGALRVKAHGSGPGGGTGQIFLEADHTSARSAQLLVQAGSGDADPNQSKVWARAVGNNGFSDNIVNLIDGLGQSDVLPAGLASATFQGPWNAAFVGSGVVFTITQAGSYVLVAYSSSYATIANQNIGVGLYIDNAGRGFMRSFTNEALSHKVMVPLAVVLSFTKGNHTVEFAHDAATFPNCTSNNGDFGQIFLCRIGP